MNKRFISLLIATLLIVVLAACIPNAPSVADVTTACQQNNLQPGQMVKIGNSEYPCPSPKPTPTIMYHYVVESPLSLCDMKDSWSDAKNANWLADNLLSPSTSWKFQNKVWTYTYVPEFVSVTLGGSGYTKEYVDGFTYPGFGVFTVYQYEGGTSTVTASNSSDAVWLNFTKLELSCQ